MLCSIAVAFTAVASQGILAQTGVADYPNRPIRLVLPFTSGQGADLVVRALSQPLSELAGVPIVIDNRPGANGFIGAQVAATAAPDGYTLFVTTNTTHSANAALFKKLPYDPIKDFAPITLLNKGGAVFVVPVDSPYASVADLIAAARARPDMLTFGSASSSTRMSGELLKQMTSISVRNVPYKGTPQTLTDLMGKQIDFGVADIPTGQPLIEQGRIRALAVTSTSRHPVLKDVPTMAESGVPGYALEAWVGVFAPAGTPRPIIDKLNTLFHKALATRAGREFYHRAGLEQSPGTPEELGQFVKSETEKWARIVKGAGIEPE